MDRHGDTSACFLYTCLNLGQNAMEADIQSKHPALPELALATGADVALTWFVCTRTGAEPVAKVTYTEMCTQTDRSICGKCGQQESK